MTPIRIKTNTRLLLRGCEYSATKRTSGGRLVLEPANENGEAKIVTDDDVAQAFTAGELEILPSEVPEAANLNQALESFDERQLAEARRRMAYIAVFQEETNCSLSKAVIKPILARVAATLGDPRPPSFSSFCKWFRRWTVAGGDLRSLIPATHRRGNRKSRLSAEMDAIIDEHIETIHNTAERPAVFEVHDAIEVERGEINEALPKSRQLIGISLRGLAKRIAKLDAYDEMKARHGSRAAKIKYKAYQGCPAPTHPLQVVEIDHTKIDLNVVGDIRDFEGIPYVFDSLPKNPVILGRPWLTYALDRFSRMPLGLYIGFEPPSWLSVMQCLRHGMLPKTYLQARFPDLDAEWPCYGLIETLMMDHGAEFHSKSLDDACLSLGIDIQYAPVQHPWFKGKVERFFRTNNAGLFHSLSGTTYSNPKERGDYPSEDKAFLTLSELSFLLHHWLLKVYAVRPHRGLHNFTPLQVWQQGVAKVPVRLPNRVTDLDALLGIVEERKVHHYGVEFEGLRYNGPALAEIRRDKKLCKSKVKLKIDPTDLSAISVLHPATGKLMRVHCVDREYSTGLTLPQHRAIAKHAREVNGDKITVKKLVDARNQLRKAAAKMLENRSAQSHTRSARFLGVKADAPPRSEPSSAETRVPDAPIPAPDTHKDADEEDDFQDLLRSSDWATEHLSRNG